jgi:hypothetical protein
VRGGKKSEGADIGRGPVEGGREEAAVKTDPGVIAGDIKGLKTNC